MTELEEQRQAAIARALGTIGQTPRLTPEQQAAIDRASEGATIGGRIGDLLSNPQVQTAASDAPVPGVPAMPDQPTMAEQLARAFVDSTASNPGGLLTPGTVGARALPDADARDFWIGDDDPTTYNAGEQIGRYLNSMGEAATFGTVGEEATAAVRAGLLGTGYDEELASERDAEALWREQHPGQSLSSQLLGGMIIPGTAVARTPGLLSRIGIGAGVTGAGAGTEGFMEGEGDFDSRRSDALWQGGLGAALGMAIPVVGNGMGRLVDTWRRSRATGQAARNAPTADELRALGNDLYSTVDNAGVEVRPEAFDRLRAEMLGEARDRGLDELPGNPNTPRAARNFQRAEDMGMQMAQEPTAALPLRALDQYRRSLGPAAGDVGNRTESAIGANMIGQVDDFVQELSEADITSGDIAMVQELLPRARETWSRLMRTETVDNAIDQAQNYLGGETSGIRNQFASILRNPRLSRSFSETEQAVMRRVVNGSFPERLLRLLGNGLGSQLITGLGAGAGAVTGGLGGGLLGAVIGGGLSNIATRGSEALTRSGAERARDAIASGLLGRDGPLTPAITNRAAIDDALIRGTRSLLSLD